MSMSARGPQQAEMYRVTIDWADVVEARADTLPHVLWFATRQDAINFYDKYRKQGNAAERGDAQYPERIIYERVYVVYGNNRQNLSKLLNQKDFVKKKVPIFEWTKFIPRRTQT